MIGKLLNHIEPEASKNVIFINPGRNRSRDIPVMEVRMDNKELARKIRKQFAAKRKAGEDFGRVFVTNSVSLATRVRVDILKVIARLNSTEKEECYVTAYNSRPVMHIKQKNDISKFMALTFSDAISKYGGSLSEIDLGEAYKRCGNSFKGQLQQMFVVLQDAPTGNTSQGSGGYHNTKMSAKATQMKRMREGDSTEQANASSGTPRKMIKKA